MNKARGVSWELSLEPSWETQSDEECETLFCPDGVGALQISSARKEGDVTDDDLNNFAADHLNTDTKTKPVILGDFSGIAIQHKADGSLWRRWFLRYGPVALFVTYNCAEEDSGVEDVQVNKMLGTLRAIQNAL